MANTFILILVLAIVSVLTTHAADPELKYDPATGRVKCNSDKKPTLSVAWDRIAQDVAAAAKKGPTISAGLYGVMHSAIYDAWSDTRNSNSHNGDDSSLCSLNKVAMSRAGYHSIIRIMPDGTELATKAFNDLHPGCRGSTYFDIADDIGRRAARKMLARSTQHRLQDNQPQFTHSSAIERWTPEHVPIDDPTGPIQKYLTPAWGSRRPFGIQDGTIVRVKDPVPVLLVPGELDVDSSRITLRNGTVLPVSPGLVGTVINPEFIDQADRVVKASAALTDKQKFIAEFWEQGGETSFPPGAWMTIAQYVSFRDSNTDDEDAGLFYALGNAVNDAGVSTWYIKKFYNYARPVRVIRDLAKLGLLSPQSSYSISQGMVTDESLEKFETYQMVGSDPSPPFPEYVSGHSTFSSAAAEVLKRWTGSDNFGGSVTLNAKASRFETNTSPTSLVTLSWNTFSAAAAEAGISRIYGGIHFDDGNDEGLKSGKKIGVFCYTKSFRHWDKAFRRWKGEVLRR